jgi:protein TonB
MLQEEKDKKNKRAGMIASVITHAFVLILFVFLVAWRAPNPPLPEIGIELNFGTSNQGSGDVQPEPNTPPADTESEEDSPETPEEVIEEVVEEVVPDPVEETADPVVENTATESEVKPVTETPTADPVKEIEPKKEEPKPVVEEKKETPKPPKVLYPGTKDGEATEAKNANQGDKTDAVGDQGAKEGTVDSRALYGKPGGGDGGAALEMAGWMWNKAPEPEDETQSEGKIVFKVIIDERGEVVSAIATTNTVTSSLMRLYQAEVMRLTFTQTSQGTPPPRTEGKITFIIKSK